MGIAGEFVDHKWIKYLKGKELNFVIRFPKNHSITTVSGETVLFTEFTHRVPLGLPNWSSRWDSVRKLTYSIIVVARR